MKYETANLYPDFSLSTFIRKMKMKFRKMCSSRFYADINFSHLIRNLQYASVRNLLLALRDEKVF